MSCWHKTSQAPLSAGYHEICSHSLEMKEKIDFIEPCHLTVPKCRLGIVIKSHTLTNAADGWQWWGLNPWPPSIRFSNPSSSCLWSVPPWHVSICDSHITLSSTLPTSAPTYLEWRSHHLTPEIKGLLALLCFLLGTAPANLLRSHPSFVESLPGKQGLNAWLHADIWII